MRFKGIDLHFEAAAPFQTNQSVREYRVCHFILTAASWTNHSENLHISLSTSATKSSRLWPFELK